MLLRNLFQVVSEEQMVKLIFNLEDYLIGNKLTMEECLTDTILDYTIINVESNDEDMLCITVEYVN